MIYNLKKSNQNLHLNLFYLRILCNKSLNNPLILFSIIFITYRYYCKYSGKHALTTDCNLNTAPRRRTDHALVIDTTKYTAKLYTTDGGAKFLKRRSGTVERQYRFNIGKLPIAYRTEPEGKYLYIFDDALTTLSVDESGASNTGSGKPPIPPCIVPIGPQGGTKVALEIEDRGPRHVILKVSADSVRVQTKNAIQSSGLVEELLDFMRGLLGVRLSQMQLERGETPRHKTLVIDNVAADVVFEKLSGAVKNFKPRGRY
jgi:uncharacterized protein YggU (UPF0235/DUF167 family)